MTVDYGYDLICGDDLDPVMTEGDSVAHYVYRRLTTRKGSLLDDPDWGIDVTEYLSGQYTELEIAGHIRAELSDDDRILITGVTLSGSEISVRGELDGDGPFDLVVRL